VKGALFYGRTVYVYILYTRRIQNYKN